MDDLRIYTEDECPQGSDEWLQVRAGIVTASDFAAVMAKGRAGAPSETRRKLMCAKAAEIITGKPCPTWDGNKHTERGKAMEAEVRDLYEAGSELPVTRVGFMRCGRMGASPDSAVGDDGLLEIKTKLPHLLIDCLERGGLPPEHKPQVQGQLLVSRRRWCDFRAYWPGLPQLRVRVYRDTDYISDLLREIQRFNHELDAMVARLRSA